MKLCKRCGQSFEPVFQKVLGGYTTCCEPCSMRNVLDGLGLPTPPELLDPYTKKPTLSRAEYRAAYSRPKTKLKPRK